MTPPKFSVLKYNVYSRDTELILLSVLTQTVVKQKSDISTILLLQN